MESGGRGIFLPIVASSGCVCAIFTGVPVLMSLKNLGATFLCIRKQPADAGNGFIQPVWKPYADLNSDQYGIGVPLNLQPAGLLRR